MNTVNIKLSEVYSVEEKLRKRTVEEYKALGIERLLVSIQENALCARTSTEPVVYELTEGCHRSRALLELGYSGEVMIGHDGLTEAEPKVLLKDVPLLEETKYEVWLREEDLL